MSVQDGTWDRPICAICGKKIPYGQATGPYDLMICREHIPKQKDVSRELIEKLKKDFEKRE